MLPKRQRLSRTEFSSIFPLTRRFFNSGVTLHYREYPDFLKVSVVVGKKVSKSAVDRNRIRRQVYAAIFRCIASEKCTGYYIFVLTPPFTAVSKKSHDGVIKNLLAQALKKG
jgi:ribonuclease P protein component